MITKRIKNITPVKINNPIIVDLKSPWDQKKIAKKRFNIKRDQNLWNKKLFKTNNWK